jgi:tripartite-type tricarboxylate transporter receptor subunit TctC
LLAPRKTPMPIVEKLREVTRKVTEDKSFIDLIENLGDEVHFITGDEMTKILDFESDKRMKLYERLIKEKK